MVNLKLQKRLASSVIGCGKSKVWLDPNEAVRLNEASSREDIRKLIRSGLIVRKPDAIHSRGRARIRAKAVAKGRHRGLGKRRGTKEARFPSKLLWIRRVRVQRHLLKRFRDNNTIDKHEYVIQNIFYITIYIYIYIHTYLFISQLS